MKLRIGYALAAIMVFVTETGIALFVHDAMIRPYIGDSLAVILLYLALRAVTPLRVLPAILVALAIAFAIEFGQMFHLIDALGLRGNRIAGFILGGYFDVKDLAAYVAGAIVILLLEKLRGEQFVMKNPEVWTRYIAPLILLTIATVLIIWLFDTPSMVAVKVNTNLTKDNSHTVAFMTAYNSSYTIGVEMDQRPAMQLFPCSTNPNMLSPGCYEVFPVNIALKLSEDGKDISNRIRLPYSGGGGVYGGQETYMREIGFVSLQRGKRYRLTWVSLTDGAALAPAHPRLVVDASSQLSETLMVQRFGALILAAILAIASGIWALILYLTRRNR